LRGEIAKACLDAIARSKATKQSNFLFRNTMDCFAPLAMTVSGFVGWAKAHLRRATMSVQIKWWARLRFAHPTQSLFEN
jgi:CRISPR/Cas system endoribonuclease Cas6 (RAMP superfamily)